MTDELNKRTRKRVRQLGQEQALARQLVEVLIADKQDEAFLARLQTLSLRQKRMLALELVYAQKEAQWETYVQINQTLVQLQTLLNNHLTGAQLTDYIRSIFYSDKDTRVMDELLGEAY